MKKKITVYVLLIVLVAVMLVANVFALNLLIADNVLAMTDKEAEIGDLFLLKGSSPGKSCHIASWARLPENVEYYSAMYGVIDVGDVASFDVDVNGKSVRVDIYELWAGRFCADDGGEVSTITDKAELFYMQKKIAYKDRTVIFYGQQPDDRFMVVHSSETAVTDEIVDKLLRSYYEEKFGFPPSVETE